MTLLTRKQAAARLGISLTTLDELHFGGHRRKKKLPLSEIIEKQRTRHVKTAGGWPGKPVGTPASSKYPNLLAELSASRPG